MDLQHIIGLGKKWFWALLLACFLGGVAGLIAHLCLPALYEADTTIYINSPNHNDSQSVTGDQQVAAAFASIPQSYTVLAAILKAIGDRSLNTIKLKSMITVVNNRDTQFVTIQVRDTYPHRAAQISSQIAKQSIAQYNKAATDGGQNQQFLQQEINKLQIDITSLESKLNNLQLQVNQQNGLQSNLQNQITQTNNALAEKRALYNQLLSTSISLDSTRAVILTDVQVPEQPVGAGLGLAIAPRAMAGLVMIIAVILLIEQQSVQKQASAHAEDDSGDADTTIKYPLYAKGMTRRPHKYNRNQT